MGYGENGYDVVLVHDTQACDLGFFASGRASVIDGHNVVIGPTGDVVGTVRRAWIDPNDRVLRAEIEFAPSALGQMFQADVLAGHRQNVSIGFRASRILIHVDESTGRETWFVTAWQPLEVSFVAVPADLTVGVNDLSDPMSEPSCSALMIAIVSRSTSV